MFMLLPSWQGESCIMIRGAKAPPKLRKKIVIATKIPPYMYPHNTSLYAPTKQVQPPL